MPTRECLALEVDTSFASRRVTRVLDAIIAERGMAGAIHCDNGPEFTSRHFLAWCVERQIEVIHIQPGKPTQNGWIESFHRRLREECLRVSWFQNLFDARRKIGAWCMEYNEERPHSILGYRTPKEFAAAQAAGFYTAEREARNSNAVSCPLALPHPGSNRRGRPTDLSYSYVNENRGQVVIFQLLRHLPALGLPIHSRARGRYTDMVLSKLREHLL
jgi:hypothetical protein